MAGPFQQCPTNRGEQCCTVFYVFLQIVKPFQQFPTNVQQNCWIGLIEICYMTAAKFTNVFLYGGWFCQDLIWWRIESNSSYVRISYRICDFSDFTTAFHIIPYMTCSAEGGLKFQWIWFSTTLLTKTTSRKIASISVKYWLVPMKFVSSHIITYQYCQKPTTMCQKST